MVTFAVAPISCTGQSTRLRNPQASCCSAGYQFVDYSFGDGGKPKQKLQNHGLNYLIDLVNIGYFRFAPSLATKRQVRLIEPT